MSLTCKSTVYMHARKQNERYIKENLDRKGQCNNMLMRINTVTSSIKHLVAFLLVRTLYSPASYSSIAAKSRYRFSINALCGWQSHVLFTFLFFYFDQNTSAP